MNLLKSIFFLIICSSVYGQENNNVNVTTIEPTIKDIKFKATWENLNNVPKEWVKIEKDDKGYLIYDPCDGTTPSVNVENQKFTVNSGLETDSYHFEINKTFAENTVLKIEAYDKKYNIGFIINAKIFDEEKGIFLWTFDGKKWLMIPVENIDSFRKIKNNCLTEKKPELIFLPLKQIIDDNNTSR